MTVQLYKDLKNVMDLVGLPLYAGIAEDTTGNYSIYQIYAEKPTNYASNTPEKGRIYYYLHIFCTTNKVEEIKNKLRVNMIKYLNKPPVLSNQSFDKEVQKWHLTYSLYYDYNY